MPMTMSKASGSCSLQSHQPSLAPEWMVVPSPSLMATILVFHTLACFSNLRATVESVAPVSKTAL